MKIFSIATAALMLAGAAMLSTAHAVPTSPMSETLKVARSHSEAGVQQVNWRHYRHHRHHRHHHHRSW